jgi:hypothetical protein
MSNVCVCSKKAVKKQICPPKRVKHKNKKIIKKLNVPFSQ